MASILQRVSDKHHRNGKEAKKGEHVHAHPLAPKVDFS
jgi:hypothetical protein